jgi:glutathione S-transferase
MTDAYRLLGGPGSPYSFKMRALLRYRRLPFVWATLRGRPGQFTSDLSETGSRTIPVLRHPDGTWHSDSTPLAYDLERRHAERRVLPDDPGHAFLAHLLEDVADEWLVKAMFDLRWHHDADWCSRRQAMGWMVTANDAELEAAAAIFRARQVAARDVVCGPASNRPLLEASYRRALDVLETHLASQAFLFGSRPSLAEFGWYGQLSQCAIDPTASAIMRSGALRVYQWLQLMDDASAVDGEWMASDAPLPDGVVALLRFAGDVYLPYLVANAAARAEGAETFTFTAWGMAYEQRPLSYPAKCLRWLREDLAAMPADAMARTRPVLEATGCWESLAPH